VIKQEWGSFVVLRIADGSEQVITWAEILRVSLAPRLPAPSQPTVASPAKVSGLTSTPAAQAPEREPVSPTLAPPPGYVIDVGTGGFAEFGSFAAAKGAGGGGEIAVQSIIGISRFPDLHGGSWHGVVAQAYFQPWGGAFWIDNAWAGHFSLNGGIGGGYAYLHTGEIDPDQKQGGIGFMATYRVGAEHTSLWGGSSEGYNFSGSGAGLAHGPWVALLFPTYNGRRGTLAFTYLAFNVVMFDLGNGASGTQWEIGSGRAF
jgi:hypothetical protein